MTPLCVTLNYPTLGLGPAYPAASFGSGLALMSVCVFLSVGSLRQIGWLVLGAEIIVDSCLIYGVQSNAVCSRYVENRCLSPNSTRCRDGDSVQGCELASALRAEWGASAQRKFEGHS